MFNTIPTIQASVFCIYTCKYQTYIIQCFLLQCYNSDSNQYFFLYCYFNQMEATRFQAPNSQSCQGLISPSNKNQRISDRTISKTNELFRRLIKQTPFLSQYELQSYVKYKEKFMVYQLGVPLSTMNDLLCIKYILFNLLDQLAQTEKQDGKDGKTWRHDRQKGDKKISSRLTIQKKTSICIDFDMTQFVEKAQSSLSRKQKSIQMLQQMLIQKQKELECLEEQNAQLRKQIQHIISQGSIDRAIREQQSEKAKDQVINILSQNQQLKSELGSLAEQFKIIEEERQQPFDQFLRRCLFSQAVSIQHFLTKNT